VSLVKIGPHPSMEGRGQDGSGGEIGGGGEINDGGGIVEVRSKINDVEHG
jgi:hypothetical protein